MLPEQVAAVTLAEVLVAVSVARVAATWLAEAVVAAAVTADFKVCSICYMFAESH